MLNMMQAGLAMVYAIQAPASILPVADPLSLFTGDWQVVDTATGKTVQDCTKAQSFTVTPDRRTVVLTEKWANDWTARYIVLHQEAARILTFIEDEKRTTKNGDPILWWAYFDGPDKFRWRQYDLASDAATTAEWRRCPAAR